MNLKSLAKTSETAVSDAIHKLKHGHPLSITFDEVVTDSDELMIRGHLLIDSFHLDAGTRIGIKQSVGTKSGRTLIEAVKGTRKTPALKKGDVVVFESAYPDSNTGIAMVGPIACRTHDALMGKAQVLTAMARVSQSGVSKRGAWQSITIASGAAAVIIKSLEDVEKAFSDVSKSAWPGGAPGFIIRTDNGTTEFIAEKDAGIDYLIDEMKHEDILSENPNGIELIPIWRLPMGRSQVCRDINPTEIQSKKSGPFTRKFEEGLRAGSRGFLPCLVIVADEEEWAFGAQTGKMIKVASGVNPVLGNTPVVAARLPSSYRRFGGNFNGVRCMYSEEELIKHESERMEIQRAADEKEEVRRPSLHGLRPR